MGNKYSTSKKDFLKNEIWILAWGGASQRANIFPKNAEYIPKEMGTILAEDFIIKEFNQRGWKWGGN